MKLDSGVACQRTLPLVRLLSSCVRQTCNVCCWHLEWSPKSRMRPLNILRILPNWQWKKSSVFWTRNRDDEIMFGNIIFFSFWNSLLNQNASARVPADIQKLIDNRAMIKTVKKKRDFFFATWNWKTASKYKLRCVSDGHGHLSEAPKGQRAYLPVYLNFYHFSFFKNLITPSVTLTID